MPQAEGAAGLTDALEDYLETVFELVRDQKVARVKDIAAARGVRPGSVSPAMRRLADLRLVEYERREYITLTSEGERRARRIVARHQILARLFGEILRMDPAPAQQDACALEHSLSDEAVDRLVRFFEFLAACPEARDFLERFHACSLVHDDVPGCDRVCSARDRPRAAGEPARRRLGDLVPGERASVTQVDGRGEVRQRLLDAGIMPGVDVEVDRATPSGDVLWITLGGFRLSLSREEAEAVRVATR
jgi:DtxR family Mn-dependent transcriptional regulator